MTSKIWDYCVIDDELFNTLSQLDSNYLIEPNSNIKTSETSDICDEDLTSDYYDNNSLNYSKGNKFDDILTQHELTVAEETSAFFLNELDKSLKLLSEMASEYSDVTGRTNSLIQNCENLLEQQVSFIIFVIYM